MPRRKRFKFGGRPKPKQPPAPEPEPASVKEAVNRLSRTWWWNLDGQRLDEAFDRVKAAVAKYESPEVLELLEKKNCLKQIVWKEFTDTLEPHSRKTALERRRDSTRLVCQLLPVSARMRGAKEWDLCDYIAIEASIIGEFLRAVQEELLAPEKPVDIDVVRTLTVLFSHVEFDAVRQAIKPFVDCGLWRALPDAARLLVVEKDEFYATAWANVEGRERPKPDPSNVIVAIVVQLMTLSLRATVEDVDLTMLSAILELMALLLGHFAMRPFVEPLVVASGTGAAVAALAERLSPARQKVKQQVARFLAELRAPVNGVTGQELEFDERQRRHAADVVRLQQELANFAAPSLQAIARATVEQIGRPRTFVPMVEDVLQAGELPLLLIAAKLDSLNEWAAEHDPRFALPWPRIVAAHYQAPEPLPALRGPLPDADALFSAPPVLPWARERFLTFEDLARHCSTLAELETADELVRQLAEALLRLDVRADGTAGGWAHDAVLLKGNFAPIVGLDAGGLQADVTIDLTPFPEPVRAEWRTVKSQDQFCVVVLAGRDSEAASAGQPPAMPTFDAAVNTPSALRDFYGIHAVLPAHLLAHIDEDANVDHGRRFSALKQVLRLRIAGSVREKPLHTVLMRLRPAVTEAVARTAAVQMLLDPAHRGRFQLPQWCQATILGYGDRSGASMSALSPQSVYVGDTLFESQFSWRYTRRVRRENGSGLWVAVVNDEKANHDQRTIYRELDASDLGSAPPRCYNSTEFDCDERQAILAGCARGLSIVDSGNGSGKTVITAQIAATLYHAPAEYAPRGPTALIASTEAYIGRVLARVFTLGVRPWHVARPGTDMQLQAAIVERQRLLDLVAQIAAHLGVSETVAESAAAADEFFRSIVQPKWAAFEREVAHAATALEVWATYPFPKFQVAEAGGAGQDGDAAPALESAKQLYTSIAAVFADLETLQILEVLQDPQDRAKVLLRRAAKLVVGMSAAEILAGGGAQPFSSIIVLGATQLRMADVLPAIASASVERICLLGTDRMVRPVVSSSRLRYRGARDSLFGHLVRLEVPVVHMSCNLRCAGGPMWQVYAASTTGMTNSEDPSAFGDGMAPPANAGFACVAQSVQVPGLGETRVAPGRVVRSVEADYVVGVFQYMRLIGYDADQVAIVCMTDAQVDLVRDEIAKRCGKDPQYGWPAAIVTPYTAGGVECEIVLVSLVYTIAIPEALDDPRIIMSTVSRASHGAYFFGELALFSRESRELMQVLDCVGPTDALYLRGDELADGSVRRHPRNTGLAKTSNDNWKVEKGPNMPLVYKIESAEDMSAHVAKVAAERAAARARTAE